MAFYIGLMSGTSMDGIDAVLVDVSRNVLIKGITSNYSNNIKQQLISICSGEELDIASLAQLNTLIGREFARVVRELMEITKTSKKDIVAIGSHGQTIRHDATSPIPYTLQLGCPHTISSLTGLTVVADFRTRDLVLGGHGAPIAPIYHQILFGGIQDLLAVVNVGGIANLTLLKDGHLVGGYDTGPGNCLMDLWARTHANQAYDSEGVWASSGEVIQSLLSSLCSDPYFERSPPKSVGKEYFSYRWLSQHLSPNFAQADVQATLLMLTVVSISEGIQCAPFKPERVLVCGGGVHNKALMRELMAQLPTVPVESTGSLGIDPNLIEAMTFAWLADKTLSQMSVDLTQVTGAAIPTVLGAIYPSPIT